MALLSKSENCILSVVIFDTPISRLIREPVWVAALAGFCFILAVARLFVESLMLLALQSAGYFRLTIDQ